MALAPSRADRGDSTKDGRALDQDRSPGPCVSVSGRLHLTALSGSFLLVRENLSGKACVLTEDPLPSCRGLGSGLRAGFSQLGRHSCRGGASPGGQATFPQIQGHNLTCPLECLLTLWGVLQPLPGGRGGLRSCRCHMREVGTSGVSWGRNEEGLEFKGKNMLLVCRDPRDRDSLGPPGRPPSEVPSQGGEGAGIQLSSRAPVQSVPHRGAFVACTRTLGV